MCVVLSQALFVVSVKSTVVVNILTPSVVGIILFIKDTLSDILCCSILRFWLMQCALRGRFAV